VAQAQLGRELAAEVPARAGRPRAEDLAVAAAERGDERGRVLESGLMRTSSR